MGARQSSQTVQGASASNGDKNDAATAISEEATPEAIDRRLSINSVDTSEQQQYTPPSSPVKPLAHYIFLVHGIFGNDQEMGYLAQAFQKITPPPNGDETLDLQEAKRVKRSGSEVTQQMLAERRREHSVESTPPIVVHSVKCNVGKTHDGIRNGGARLANEMMNFIRSDVQQRMDGKCNENHQNVTYSIVGNSLGGLYARYAVSLLPYQLQLFQNNPASSAMINLHPNVFCTTATPHLGVSRHTYLPIPRFAEAAIGAGMGTTGRDLFRLNSQKDLASAAAENVVGVAERGVRRLSALRPKGKGEDETQGQGEGNNIVDAEDAVMTNADDDLEMECIIRNMCLQDKYLAPLRNFRRRIAYANAYGTDFQVPCLTAAFLHERSGVGHFVEASRDLPPPPVGKKEESEEENAERSMEMADVEQRGAPPFIVATVRTETTSQPQSPKKASRDDTPSDDLLRMSQSLDSLGWTKVFIDVRDRIPVPRLAKPTWLRPPCGSLDELIRERGGLTFASLSNRDLSAANVSDSRLKVDANELILTSQELAQSTNAGDSIDFPLGHTVMVANSKNEKYSELNSQGRPVMDKLAKDMVHEILEFV